MEASEIYELNKNSKIGTSCICPSCKVDFIKSNHQQAFCGDRKNTICKNKYWNAINGSKQPTILDIENRKKWQKAYYERTKSPKQNKKPKLYQTKEMWWIENNHKIESFPFENET